MAHPQPGILAAVPPAARYMMFRLRPEADPRAALTRLAALSDGEQTVVGIGSVTVAALDKTLPGLREASAIIG